MIDWEIQPLTGFGPLTLGMTRANVTTVLGPPASERRFSAADHREYRGKGPRGFDVILGYSQDVLTDATFPFQANIVRVLGRDAFSTPADDLIAALKQANGGSYAVYDGMIIAFDALGIVLSDWSAAATSDKWIAAGSAEGFKVMVGSRSPDEIVT